MGQGIIDRHGGKEQYVRTTEINCEYQRRKDIYISADGLIFPCGYLASIHTGYDFLPSLERWGGKEMLDPLVHSLRGVVEGPVFEKISQSWTNDERMPKCALSCGDLGNVVRDDTVFKLTHR